MLKEIFEQPKAVADTLIGRLSDIQDVEVLQLMGAMQIVDLCIPQFRTSLTTPSSLKRFHS